MLVGVSAAFWNYAGGTGGTGARQTSGFAPAGPLGDAEYVNLVALNSPKNDSNSTADRISEKRQDPADLSLDPVSNPHFGCDCCLKRCCYFVGRYRRTWWIRLLRPSRISVRSGNHALENDFETGSEL